MDGAGVTATVAEGERILALRVLQQAVADAAALPVTNLKARTQCRPTLAEQEEARRFLYSPAGEWAAARAWWCEAAGVAPEWLEKGAQDAPSLPGLFERVRTP